MVSATDVITYIGVPLAVLGVMPIIYNTIITLITLAKVRRMLRHGRLAGIARGDVVNHVIEVELPRYTIAPLHREEHSKEYWKLCDYPSHIPGGTWTTFNWRRHNTGSKTQRIDYSDQLRQPQAEIGFEELISFLLDLGAVPDATGFRMLRGSGLWVPTGTPLLVSPDRHEAVLTIAPLDDSDGYLSLAVRWSSTWGMRDASSLPPYWVMVQGPLPARPDTTSTAHEKHPIEDDEQNLIESEHAPNEDVQHKRSSTSTEPEKQTVGDVKQIRMSKTAKYIPIPEDSPPAIRCRVGLNGLLTAIPDDPDPSLFAPLSISHLLIDEMHTNTAGIWFASALTAISTTSTTILWSYKIPTPLLTFCLSPSVPCGVLVLLSLVPSSATPEWETTYASDEAEAREESFRKMRETSRSMLRENALSGPAKDAAIRERQLRSHEEWVDGLKAKQRRDVERKEKRMSEALQSPKWDAALVAQHALTWLKTQTTLQVSIAETADLKTSISLLLYHVITIPSFAEQLAKMLDTWTSFVSNSGLRKTDYLFLAENTEMFAYASLFVAVVAESAGMAVGEGSLAMDLQECIRVWKKVRLG